MSETVLIVLTLVSAAIVLLFVGPYSAKGVIWAKTGKEATFFGSDLFYGSPEQVVQKYPLSMYAAPLVAGGIRPLIMIWNIAGMLFLLHRSVTGKALNAPKKFYLAWTWSWIVTVAWVFIFDWEMQVLITAITLLLHVSACYALKLGCEFYQKYDAAPKSNISDGKLFRYLVLEGIALLSVWGFPATCMSFAIMLAYKDSLHSDVADMTGFFSPEEASTAGLVLILVRFIVWWIFDVIYWGKCSDSFHSAYPTFAIVLLAITTENYDSDAGLTLNNMLSLTSVILSVLAFFTRNIAKDYFQTDRRTARSHRD